MDDSLKWIKLAVNIFENRKIQYIETMPDADTILVIWFKLLTLAGTINDCGQIYMTREIPYTEEMLAAHFKRPLNTVRLALQIFEKLDMIEIVDDFTKLTNWEKYQNTEALATAREKGRLRVQAFRERQKLAQIEEKEPCGSGVNERNVTVTLRNAVDKNREEENRKEKNRTEEERVKEEAQRASSRTKEPRHQYGEYKNVLLSDTEIEKLKTEFPDDYEKRIDDLSYYMKRTGRSYKDHLAAIRSWARSDAKKAGGGSGRSPQRGSAEDLQNSYDMFAKWAAEETEG